MEFISTSTFCTNSESFKFSFQWAIQVEGVYTQIFSFERTLLNKNLLRSIIAANKLQVNMPIRTNVAHISSPSEGASGIQNLDLLPKNMEKIEPLIETFGWKEKGLLNPDLLNTARYCDFLDFLYDSKLIFSIRGYQHSLAGAIHPSMQNLQEAIRLAPNGHPLLLVQGEWMPWGDLIALVEYDKKGQKISARHDSSLEWNYFAPAGLTERGRFHDTYPIYQLSLSDLATLKSHGEKFFRGDVPEELNENRDWSYLQVFTSDNDVISKLSHVGIRLIQSNGQVYSLGFETLLREPSFNQQHFVGTYDVGITSLDYDELKPFDSRRVTTIPLTEGEFRNAVERIHHYNDKSLRFNRLHQNCTTYVTDIMRAANHPVEVRSSLLRLIIDTGPQFPLLIKIKNSVKDFFASILPGFIAYLIETAYNIVGAVALRTSSFITNLISLCFGSGRGSTPDPSAPENNIDNQDEMRYFNRLISSPFDLFSNEAATIYSPAKLVNWQLAQPSTFIHKYGNSPKFTFVPKEER